MECKPLWIKGSIQQLLCKFGEKLNTWNVIHHSSPIVELDRSPAGCFICLYASLLSLHSAMLLLFLYLFNKQKAIFNYYLSHFFNRHHVFFLG